MSRKRGFTLVELLVVIAIIGILVALLLPAVQAAREASRRMKCGNNLKQLGLAIHNHFSARRVLPTGSVSGLSNGDSPRDRRGWFEAVLPYLEEQALYDQLNSTLASFLAMPQYTCYRPGTETPVATMSCPSEVLGVKNTTKTTTPPNGEGFSANYALCIGNDYSTTKDISPNGDPADEHGFNRNGIFYAKSKTKFKDITDGTSHTVMGSEIILSADVTTWDVRGTVHSPIDGGCFFNTIYSPNHPTIGDYPYQYCQNIRMAPCYPPNGPRNQASSYLYVLARSYHSGGVNAIMADGSIHFIPDSINESIWNALGSRAAGDNATGGQF